MPQRPGRAASASPPPPAPPVNPFTAHADGLRLTSEVANACLNAVAAIAAQVAAIKVLPAESGTEVVADLHPEALRLAVGRLREAVSPVEFSGIEPGLYARAEAVRIPGLRLQQGAKRTAVYATSYHAAVVALGCGLYHRLAEKGLAYWTDTATPGRIDLREYFDEAGGRDSAAVPVYRDFPVRRWPQRVGRAVVAEAVAADPAVNVARLTAELQLEIRLADEQHQSRVRRWEATTHAGVVAAAEGLERQFTAAIAVFGPGHALTVCVYPFDDMPPGAEQLIFAPPPSIPPAGRPEAWALLMPLGHAILADHIGCKNNLMYVLFLDENSPHGRQAAEVFVGLARQAGASCFLAPDMTAAGPASQTEIVWLNTLYACLKGTDAVEDRAGHSRIRFPFAASLRLLGQMIRGDKNGQNPPCYDSLRPGLPGSVLDGLVIQARVPTPEEAATTRAQPNRHEGSEGQPHDRPSVPRRPRPTPPVYLAIRTLRDHGLTVGKILTHLKTPEGKGVRELVDAELQSRPAKRGGGRKRTRKDVVRAALRDCCDPG